MPQNNLPVKSIDSALVVGAGIMGHGFAQLLAMNNIEVFLVDQSDDLLDRARCWIVDNLDYMIELGKLNASGKESRPVRNQFHHRLGWKSPQGRLCSGSRQ